MNISVLLMQSETKSTMISLIRRTESISSYAFVLWLLFFFLHTTLVFTQPVRLNSQEIQGLLGSSILNHQGHRFSEALLEELLRPDLYPVSTQLTQSDGPFHNLPLTIEYSSLSHEDLLNTKNTNVASLPIFLDQMIEITIPSPASSGGNSVIYDVVVPLSTPEVFWPVIEELNKTRSLLVVSNLEDGWERLRRQQAASLITSVQSLLTWFLGIDCSELESHQISSFGPLAQGHFMSTNPQLITLLNLGIRLVGTNGVLQVLGDQFFTHADSPCIQQLPSQFFLRY